MTTYNQLLTDIDGFLSRDDMSGIAPTLVILAEARMLRELRLQSMLARSRAVGDGSRFLALPTGYLEMVRLSILDGNYMFPLQLRPVGGLRSITGSDPNEYCVHEEIELNASFGSDSEIEMVWYRVFEPLSFTNISNWISTNAYDAYLYGSLAASAPYVREDERVPMWDSAYMSAIARLTRQEERTLQRRGGIAVSMSGNLP